MAGIGIERGDIYWADLEPTKGREQAGRRPVLVISHETFNQHSGTVIAMAITSQLQRAGFPLTYPIPSQQGLKDSWVKISQIRTLSTERLSKKLTHLEEEEVNRIIEGLLDIVGP